MPVNYNWTPQTGQYVETPEEVQKFKEVHDRLQSVVSCAEKWASAPSSPTGLAYLAESENHYLKMHAVLNKFDTNPSREMKRIYEAYAFIKSFFYAAKDDRLDSRLSFGSGMKVQQYLNRLRRLRDEWKQIVDYAENNNEY